MPPPLNPCKSLILRAASLRRQSLYPSELRAPLVPVYILEVWPSIGADFQCVDIADSLEVTDPVSSQSCRAATSDGPLPNPEPVRTLGLFWKSVEVCRRLVASSATATAAATATAISSPPPPPPAAALHLGTSLVDVECASAHLCPVQGGDCFVSLFRVGHLHKPETA